MAGVFRNSGSSSSSNLLFPGVTKDSVLAPRNSQAWYKGLLNQTVLGTLWKKRPRRNYIPKTASSVCFFIITRSVAVCYSIHYAELIWRTTSYMHNIKPQPFYRHLFMFCSIFQGYYYKLLFLHQPGSYRLSKIGAYSAALAYGIYVYNQCTYVHWYLLITIHFWYWIFLLWW